jgi:coenzyme F420-0:L-glutamate ligase/coenzyme F420-1:gamma-L-glutamate ligase
MLTLTPLNNFPFIQKGDDLSACIQASLESTNITLRDGDILVLAQKIVSKAEGRQIHLDSIKPSDEAIRYASLCEKDPRLVELILQESNSVLRVHPGTIIVEHRLGFICANAGIDHSNVSGENNLKEDHFLLLPENPDLSASVLRRKLKNIFGINLAIMIIDSHGRAWRLGVAGISIGFSGIPGLVDMRGKPDLFGTQLRITQIAVADELAGAASLVMGQASEGLPVIHVRGFPYTLRDGNLKELIRPTDEDLFR